MTATKNKEKINKEINFELDETHSEKTFLLAGRKMLEIEKSFEQDNFMRLKSAEATKLRKRLNDIKELRFLINKLERETRAYFGTIHRPYALRVKNLEFKDSLILSDIEIKSIVKKRGHRESDV